MCLHGVRDMKVDAGGNLSSLLDGKQLAEEAETLSDGSGPKRFKCSACPYVSDSKSQYVYHRQFHRPRGAPYKCPKCSYNVSRRHLLNQHLRVHGLPPVKGEGSMGHGSDQYGSDSDGGSSLQMRIMLLMPAELKINFKFSASNEQLLGP